MILNILLPVFTAVAALVPGTSGEDRSAGEPPMNLVEVATDAGSFHTLVAALKAAGLVETLSGDGPFTVLAPTDEAFARIPQDELQALIADKEALTAVLTYHVIPGRVMSTDVVALSSANTVNGQSVEVKVMEGRVMIDEATVITPDIEASNGVIHVIDRVILPEM